MKPTLAGFVFYLFTFIAIHSVHAQDTIVKKDNEIIKAKVLEITTDEIKYRYFDAPDGPTIVLNKEDIKTLRIKGADDKMMNVINNVPSIENPVGPDIIIKKNGEQVKAKIVEIGTTQIKYRFYDAPDGPVVVMDKREIKTIKIKGKTDKAYDVINNTPDPMSISNTAITDKTSSLKFNFFSPLNRHLAFSYEWMIRPGYNWETGLGIVGPGVSITSPYLNDRAKGVFVRTGPKFLLGNSSDIEIEGARYAHPLKGRYFKIETIMYALSSDYSTVMVSSATQANSVGVHHDYLGITLDIVYGRQIILGNSITMGWYAGVGYGFESNSTSFTSNPIPNYEDFDPRRFSHSYFGNTFPLILTAGFNIGYIFKTPLWLSREKISNKPPSRHSLKND